MIELYYAVSSASSIRPPGIRMHRSTAMMRSPYFSHFSSPLGPLTTGTRWFQANMTSSCPHNHCDPPPHLPHELPSHWLSFTQRMTAAFRHDAPCIPWHWCWPLLAMNMLFEVFLNSTISTTDVRKKTIGWPMSYMRPVVSIVSLMFSFLLSLLSSTHVSYRQSYDPGTIFGLGVYMPSASASFTGFPSPRIPTWPHGSNTVTNMSSVMGGTAMIFIAIAAIFYLWWRHS